MNLECAGLDGALDPAVQLVEESKAASLLRSAAAIRIKSPAVLYA
jgi:hypothetical protein